MVYAALILHEIGEEITGEKISALLESVDITVDTAKIENLLHSLEGISITEVLKGASIVPATSVNKPVPQITEIQVVQQAIEEPEPGILENLFK